MSMTISVRMKHNSMQNAANQRRHDLRSGKVIPAYIDQDRSHLNSVVIKPMMEAEARHVCEERRKQTHHWREMKSSAAVLTAGIITFGRDAQSTISSLPVDKQDQMYEAVGRRLADKLNTDLTGLVVHRDESAPHAHFSMLSVNKDGRPLSKVIVKDLAKELQDIAGQVMAEHGLGEIKRGKPKAQRIQDKEPMHKWLHLSLTQLHELIPGEIDTAEKRKLEADKEADAAEARRIKNQQLADAAQAKLDAGQGNLDKLEKNIGIYRKREAAAKAEIDRLAKEKSELDADIESKKSILSNIRKKMPELNGKKTLLRNNIVISPDELENYHREIADFIRQRAQQNTKKERDALEEKEQALVAKEGALTNREYELEAWNETLTTRENRITGHDELVTENQRLKTRLSTIGLHIGKVMGIENAGMNGGKILNAMESSFSMEEFRKNLQAQRLTTGHDSGLTLDVS